MKYTNKRNLMNITAGLLSMPKQCEGLHDALMLVRAACNEDELNIVFCKDCVNSKQSKSCYICTRYCHDEEVEEVGFCKWGEE